MHSIAFWPGSVQALMTEYDMVEAGERRLSDVISGWLDPHDQVAAATPVSEQQKQEADKKNGDSDDDEDENPSGIDPEEAKERFDALRAQLKKTDAAVKRYGRGSKSVGKSLDHVNLTLFI